MRIHRTDAMTAEVDRIREEVTSGTRRLAALRDTLERTREEEARAREETHRLQDDLAGRKAGLSGYDADTVARRARIEQLKSDVRALEESTRRLEAGSRERAPPGQDANTAGSGGAERQYLEGLRVRGRHVLILLDVSTSMLHEDLVNILLLRHADAARKRAAGKWRRALAITRWVLARLPEGASYQVLVFNTSAHPVLPESGTRWLAASDSPARTGIGQQLEALTPDGGTSLYTAFAAARSLKPEPDQIVLITDGLPTQGKTAGLRKYVNSDVRVQLFDDALLQLPTNVPVDSVLLPMKGDSQAAHKFWYLARITHGTLIMPARDWP